MATELFGEDFSRHLLEGLNEELKKAAEPILQQAMADMEKEMRKRLAANLIAFLQNNYRIEYAHNELVIRVGMDKAGNIFEN